MIQLTRLRRWLGFTAGAVVLAMLIIGYTPLVPWLTTPLPGGDTLQSAPAVVVLGAESTPIPRRPPLSRTG